LDDVLSALDVHTARWVVDKCFAGPLLKGRTVILVTHNVAMTSRLAENVVEIASDGAISQRTSVAEALSGNPKLVAKAAEDTQAIEKANEAVDEPKPDDAIGKTSGKLIADEEVALGRVSMKASKSKSFH
jgi:ABC-type nitrate/sulfonate/bicarbonate transport system ATPase subunit